MVDAWRGPRCLRSRPRVLEAVTGGRAAGPQSYGMQALWHLRPRCAARLLAVVLYRTDQQASRRPKTVLRLLEAVEKHQPLDRILQSPDAN